MKLQTQNLECRLRADRPVRLERAAEVRLVCVHGAIWLTLYGCADDIFLCAGESYLIATNKLALLEAVGPESAGVRIVPPARKAPCFRWVHKAAQSLAAIAGILRDRVAPTSARCRTAPANSSARPAAKSIFR
ncbi:MAG: DUF2917 domain-containing protein [Betaproteobacteria bacterium]|nr:DUF2917 domain-containing protein [Betaproteobacteria bacterium]